VKKKDKEKKKADRANRKEEREKCQRMQWEAREEEESSEEEDDEVDDDEGVHPYDWLDSLAKDGEQPERPSLLFKGWTPHDQLLLREPEDLDLRLSMVAPGEGEPLKPLGCTRPERIGGSRS
jgi:hypothetical protein